MNEGYYALAIAMCARHLVWPEEAFSAPSNGRPPRRETPRGKEIHEMRLLGVPWNEIGEMFDMSTDNAYSHASRWRKKLREGGCSV